MAFFLRLGILLFILAGCEKQMAETVVIVKETIGVQRNSELITTTIIFKDTISSNTRLVATDLASFETIPVQVLDASTNNLETQLTLMFPVTIGPKQSKKYRIETKARSRDTASVQLYLSDDKMRVQNRTYDISFSNRDARGGQIDGIKLKDFKGQLLKRGHISMHWAPNFSKTTSDNYFNMEDLPIASLHSIDEGLYRIVKKREGLTDSVPEIKIAGTYEFFADQPYFIFESTMMMESDVELSLLRNDEMTMDSLFTHVMYLRKDHGVSHLNLYHKELNNLDNEPIPDNTPWVAFYNNEIGYGFGSIRLTYDNNDVKGTPSPTRNPYTKISKATGAGRYWNRVLLEENLLVPKGSRYYEKNAYLVFDASGLHPEKEIQEYYQKLTSPLLVTMLQ